MLMLSCGPLALVAAQPAAAQAVDALPTGGTVVGGTATIGTPSPLARLDVTQTSARAIIEWNSFDIGQNAEVAFAQPSASAIALNRVTGGSAPSQIAGKLTANGIVAVLNGNGVLFAGTADVDVGGLVVSTGQIDNAAFMAGGNLAITGATGGEILVSAGAGITVADAGLAAFVAPRVRNSGTITATAGRVQFGAGTAFTLDLAGDGLLQIGVGAESPLVENHGSVFAAGGQIQLSARQASALIDQTIRTGVLPVGSARLDGNTIVLDATGSDVEIASVIEGAGNLVASGNRIFGAADLNVDGNLTLNVNAGGAVADTLATGDNWIGDALAVIGGAVDRTTINLGAGLYRPGVAIDADNVTLEGQGVARIGWLSGVENAVEVWGDGATVRGFEIFGPASAAYTTYGWGSTNSRGVFVHRFADDATVAGNVIHDIRTGVIVDGRNEGVVVAGNLIDNTKSAISVQYTDGSNLVLAGNGEGPLGNEWGINVHLNGILQSDGTTINPSTSSVGGVPVGLLGTASSAEQQRLLALRAANNGLSVQNIAYSAANRTQAYVAPGGGSVTQGSRLSPLASVQAGVNAVVTGGSVFVLPGQYSEGVTGVGLFGGVGGQNFGLHVPKHGVTIRGVDASWQPITRAEDVAAYVTSLNQAGFGAQHFIAGSNVTIEGMGFRPVSTGTNKTLEVIGDNFTLRNSVIDNSGNGTAANFYISDFEELGTPRVERFRLEGNVFHGGTTVSAMVVVGGGVGRSTDAANRVFTGNQLLGSGLAGRRGFQIQGRIPSVGWQLLPSGAATITDNVFTDVDLPVRTTGLLTTELAWDDVFRNNGNLFVGGALLVYIGSTSQARGVLVTDGGETYEEIRITRGVQPSIDRALAGDTVRMLDGSYNIGSTPVTITKGISVVGESQASTIIDGRGVGAGLGTMQVQADNVSLSQFTLYGADSGANNYGIKVQPNPAAYSPDQRLLNFAISDVTVRGSTRAELDLNGVVGATIVNFTADGRRVANDAPTAGAGVQITDSANVTLTRVHTLGNTWGGVALYQANKPSAYNGQTTNVTIDAAQNTFEEPLGLFSQLESTTQGFGQLNLSGFNYAVRNTDHRPDNLDGQFVFYRTSLSDAVAFAKAVGVASASSIEGYTGTAFSNVFTVADGLAINSAIRDLRAGGTVNVGVGTFAETAAVTKALTLAGAGMNATSITGGMTIAGSLSGLTLRDFAVSGSGNGTSVIGNSGVLTGLTVKGVRIDGLNVANRHGFIGGQIGGNIAITDSEFVNIRGWAAFDTRSGAGGGDGAQIASGLFSNNLIDNTIGHIAFRQQTGAATVPDLVISANTVRNVGSATNSFGAMFKAFNAGTVNFTGNSVSGVGTSGFDPAGEAAYGAVLMARGTAVLNLTGNTFTGNNQVFAVEPGRGLPGTTTFSGNNFTGNAYSIYLPANMSGGGTIAFGAGNAFTAGANTVRHVVWRSPDALDLTGVSFDGTAAANLTPTQAFAVADLITDGIDLGGFGLARLQAGKLHVTTGSGADAALRAIALGTAGDTLNLSAGTHKLGSTLFLTKDIDVAGQGKGVTVLDASGHGSYGIRVHADNVSLSGFSLNGSAAATNASYGIKVESGGSANERNTGFAISNVAIAGSRKTGLDLNAVVGATIDGVSVNGVAAGNGISITDSANVTVRNSSTTGNAWGGLALYQANNVAGGGSDQQLNNVTIEASNAFGEANGLYLQASSTLTAPGTISTPGYAFTVRNAAHRSDGAEFTFFQKTTQNAFDYAVSLVVPGSSVVQGWTGSANDRNFHVGHGALAGGGTQALSLEAAFGASATGDTINVASGTYAESAALSGARVLNFGTVVLNGLTLGAAASLKGDLTLTTGNFTATGPLALTGATGLTATNGNVSLGAVSGAQALTLSGKALTLGAANIASLTATGTSIATSGVTTSGEQSYTGPLTLSGSYEASDFTANGTMTLGAATAIAATGNVGLGMIGGAHALTVSGDAVTLGRAGIASLAATGDSIATSGVTTTGTQSYTGTTTVDGDYNSSAFTVNGSTTLAASTTVSATGNVSLGTVGGAHSLAVSGNAVTLGAAALGSLAITGNTIATSGAITTGAQSYTGPVMLGGTYNASAFTVNGTATLGGATAIIATGALSLGGVSGARALTLSGSGVTLGAVDVASLDATGTSIATSGVTTTGAQSYTGATTLSGGYGASLFVVNGATMLSGMTTIAATGNVGLGKIGGAHALTVGGGAVTLGAANVASLSATGTTIATGGATTTGAQSYTGATTLNGDYEASDLTAGGAIMLEGDTEVTASGAVSIRTVDGMHDFALVAGSATLGAFGQGAQLGAVSVLAGETVLDGDAYSAHSLGFDGTTVRLTQAYTILDTSSANGDIEIASHLVGTAPGQQSVVFVTGTGVAGDGDIALGNVGTDAVRLGDLGVTGGDFSAATVKIAGDFTSVLGGSQVFSAQTLDALGNVNAKVAGNESGPIVAGGAVSVTAGGSGSGSIIAAGPVQLAYSNEVARAISSQSSVSLAAAGPVTGSIAATGPVDVIANGLVSAAVTTGGNATIASVSGVSSSVTAGGGVNLTSSQGAVSSQVNSGGTVNVSAVGPVTGSITATGPVAVSASGPVSTTVKTNNSASIASEAGVSSAVTAGGAVSLTSSQGAVSSQVNSGGTVNVNAAGPVTGSIVATGPVAVSASGPVSASVRTDNSANISSISGVSSQVTAGQGVQVTATQGAVTGSISAGGAVAVNAAGPISAAVSTTGSANVVSTSGGVSSTINAGGPVTVAAPGAVTSTISSGSTVQLTSSTPVDVQITGGAVTVNAPGGQVGGVFGEISTGEGGTFLVNDQPVVGNGEIDARQIIVDAFLAPVGGAVGAAGELVLPSGLSLALIAPPEGAMARPPVTVNSVERLGELLREGYTAIIIDLGRSGLVERAVEQEEGLPVT